jgi:hypothetical protein
MSFLIGAIGGLCVWAIAILTDQEIGWMMVAYFIGQFILAISFAVANR